MRTVPTTATTTTKHFGMIVSHLPVLLVVMAVLPFGCYAYTPQVNHRALAGLWKLTHMDSTQRVSLSPKQSLYPLKEFTVYPKPKSEPQRHEKIIEHVQELRKSLDQSQLPSSPSDAGKEMLLMLQEDGSFRQMMAGEELDSNSENDVDVHSGSGAKDYDTKSKGNEDGSVIPDKLLFHKDVVEKNEGIAGTNWDGTTKTIEGQWGYVDGKLILATDRSKTSLSKEDTVLVGEVVATTSDSLTDSDQDDDNPDTDGHQLQDASRKPSTAASDTHLSVPKGKVNVGKFMYPRKHPSFFEQPMFQPTKKGSFQLKQVLGVLNTKSSSSSSSSRYGDDDDDEQIEKFKVSQFHNKTFLLTAHPLPEYKPKGQVRWSIKYNKFVEDPPRNSRAGKNAAGGPNSKEDEQPTAAIRVVQVKFFANNTFATEAGLGSAAILRGRYDVIGKQRDQLWMQVWYFGFGRSVSGSVYSEGKAASKDDEKCYWGSISYEDDGGDDTEGEDAAAAADAGHRDESTNSGTNDVFSEQAVQSANLSDQRLFVKGTVLFGYGLEPLPVGRFILKELKESLQGSAATNLDDDDDDDGDDDDDDEATLEKLYGQKIDEGDSGDIDWSTSFQ
eukprot:CAMPEP_0198128608 /NCGR_PEP_ID=MMETSP1442-20131203/49744_1 /TAXON_ID= /ORGANISM="Craspedostauros australis, Strain CCMP3328" /LENGTH=612 /DNA_ID=CAMNT_0043788807 /DNA_START=174 /DNA_END=2012 /DNA_ORIENTATION=-